MTMLTRITAAALAALALLAPTAASAEDAHCNRACLSGLITTYLDAMVAHDASRLPLAAPRVRYTVDSRDAVLGEGLWQSNTGSTAFRQDYLDTAAQVAAAHLELREGTTRVLYSLVLHVEGQRIGGIETLVQRITPEGRFQPTELERPLAVFNDPQTSDTGSAGPRPTRGALIATALTYSNGLRIGNFTDAGTPFSADAWRIENGVITAGQGCFLDECGLTAQRIMVHPSLLASVAAVDEEMGTVLLWMNFGYTDSYGPGNALVTFEAFKIRDGRIAAINAFFAPLPIATPRYWTSLDPVTARGF
jgi:hypothetical protein